jgi:hypothetical protein
MIWINSNFLNLNMHINISRVIIKNLKIEVVHKIWKLREELFGENNTKQGKKEIDKKHK